MSSVVLNHEELEYKLGSPAPPCTAPAGADSIVVALARPLAGRGLVSGSTEASAWLRDGQAPVHAHGHETEVIPRLIGFDPEDASRALSQLGLAGRIVARSAGHGLLRVTAQSPAPGVPRSAGTTVRLHLSGR